MQPHSGGTQPNNISAGFASLHPPYVMAVSVVALCLWLGGCAALKPDVKPYERGALADPLMSFSRDPISDKYRQHVYDVREAARGAGLGQGGGCGCN